MQKVRGRPVDDTVSRPQQRRPSLVVEYDDDAGDRQDVRIREGGTAERGNSPTLWSEVERMIGGTA